MRLQLTVVVSTSCVSPSRPPTEVEVVCGPGATAAQLTDAIASAIAVPLAAGEATTWIAGARVDGAAPVGAPPLVDGAALTLVRGPGPHTPERPRAPRAPVSIEVAHGPDAGRTVEIPPGVHTVGRGSEASITVDDARMSRLHAVVTVTTDGITVADTGSTNGTELDGIPVGPDHHPARIGATIGVGDSLLLLRAHGVTPAATTARGDGTFAVNRRPRLVTAPPTRSISFPDPPVPARTVRVPWVAMVLPLPVAAVMALAFGPTMLAFAVMSPLLMAGNVVGDRLAGRRRQVVEHTAYLQRLRSTEARLDAACAQEVRLLTEALPDPAQTLVIATTPTAQVWERRRDDPDALAVSVGWWSTPATLSLVRAAGGEPEHPLLQRVPCGLRLGDLKVLGVCGERPAVLGVLRAMLGQLATLHSPRDLQLELVTATGPPDESWSWLGRLPHHRAPDGRPRGTGIGPPRRGHDRSVIGALAEVVRQRLTHGRGRDATWSGASTLLVLDGAPGVRGLPDLAVVLDQGPAVGIFTVAISPDRSGVPSQARAVLDLGSPETPELRLPGVAPMPVVVDRVGPWWAERLSRALAPLRDATPEPEAGAPPASVGLCDLLGIGERVPGGEAVADIWSRAPRATSVPIGHTSDGPFRIDLAADGPHVLVAGTTGAGKSELLRTLVASLAVHNRPEQLSMVLIDYKGGAAFRDCAPLPHVAAIVTDLDEHLAARALTSLRAELKRRERLLAAAEVTDFVAYEASAPAGQPRVPRLVVVIDEFRALAEELPQFVDGMVAVAALGRSLGVHLVLATQRPAGVVTADIRANMNLRIGLRLRDRSDSVDVIDAPDAAALDPAHPGRALARVAGGPATEFQSAHPGACDRGSQPDGIRVRVLPWGEVPAPWPRSPTDEDHAMTDLSLVVTAVVSAAAMTGASPAAGPWLPPLAGRIEARTLPASTSPWRFPIALVDQPALQRQSSLEVSLDEPGHWAFVGSAGSGRSTALLTMATGATQTVGPDDLHLYAVSGGSLSTLRSLSHCGAHVPIDDLVRLERLVARLSRELADRRDSLAASGHPSLREWRRAEPLSAPPVLVLVVDDWDLLAERADDHRGGQLAVRLLAVLREGAGLGLTAMLAGDRGLLVGRVASAVAHRVVLRLNDPTDLLLAGLAPSAVAAERPPGRGLLKDGTEVQVAVRLPGQTPPAKAAGAGLDGRPTSRRPWRVDALPDHVPVESLAGAPHAAGCVLLGVGGDESAPRGLDPGQDGRQWAVVGGSGSGISTTLATVSSQLVAQGRELCVVNARSEAWGALRRDPRVHWCDETTRVDGFVALRRRVPGLAVVVDDGDQLLDTPLDRVLCEMTALVDRDEGLMVVGAKAGSVAVQYRGLAVTVVRHRTGVLLGPTSASTADVLGARVPLDPDARAGRGHLVRAGVPLPIQVASTTVRR